MNSKRAPTICHRLLKILCQGGSHKFISWSGGIIGHSAQKEYARKYKIGAAAVQISETLRFISFRDDSFKNGQSNMRRFIYERSATNIRDWWLSYSFICNPWISANCHEVYLFYPSNHRIEKTCNFLLLWTMCVLEGNNLNIILIKDSNWADLASRHSDHQWLRYYIVIAVGFYFATCLYNTYNGIKRCLQILSVTSRISAIRIAGDEGYFTPPSHILKY